MITIENTYNTALVYADTLDSSAEGLIRALCGSPLSQGSRIRIMPDVHAGKGCAVGTTMTVTDKIAPGLVGADIGCGMSVFQVTGKKMELQKLDKLIHSKIPAGRSIRATPHRFAENVDLNALRCGAHIQKDKALRSIGTLGGGNHFIELDKGEDGRYWLVIHSGSRHLGVEVAGWYQNEAYRQCPEGTPYELSYTTDKLMEDYLHDLSIVQQFAEQNRQAIADEILRGMKWKMADQFSSIHNYVDSEHMLLRKGAVSAQSGERLIIPMNMRDGCLLCVGKGNENWNCSAPHGAGRRYSRSDTKQRFTLSQFKKEMKGVYSSTIGKETLDESPMAYKPMDTILAQISPAVEVIQRIYPVYNFKAGEVEQ